MPCRLEEGELQKGGAPCMMDEALDKGSMNKLFLHKGIYFVENMVTPEYIDSLEHFSVRDSDVFLVTYPKSGTVWTQQILSLIYHEGHLNNTENIQTIDRVPWLEYNLKNMDFVQRPSPRLFSTHLPYYLAPKELKNKKTKVIYVARNPKDNMTSYYHFHNMMAQTKVPPETTVNLEDFLEKFLTGKEVPSSSWFDHVSGWYCHKDEYNLLFLTYEEMVKDLRTAVRKMCCFLGKELDDETVDAIVERATFKNMKSDPLANYSFVTEKAEENSEQKKGFLRKGTIGDWKNTMTVAQNERFDKVFQEKMKDLPIKFIWDINENI